VKLTLLSALALSGASLFGQINLKVNAPAPSPQSAPAAVDANIPAAVIGKLESAFEQKIDRLDVADPFIRQGAVSGLVIPGVGIVFSTQVALVTAPVVSPFRPVIEKSVVEQVRKRKLAHLPVLRKAMVEMMKSAGAELGMLPADQKIIIAIRLQYFDYEDKSGLPAQIVMTADRASAIAGNPLTKEQ
jgi:hypothetical protein